MKLLITITSLLCISFTAFAEGGSLGCEIRTTRNGEAVVQKSVNVPELTSVSSAHPAPMKIQIGSIQGSLIEISYGGYYANKAILALTVTSSDGQVLESLGAAEGVLGLASENAGRYLSVLCRELVVE